MQDQKNTYNALQKGGLIIPSPIPVAEIVLWHRLLKGGKMNGFRFDRIQEENATTFQCLNANLIIILYKDGTNAAKHFVPVEASHILELNHKRVLYNLPWVRNEIERILNSISSQAIAS